MAVRLAKDLAAEPERDTAFHLEFTDGETYDLDQIVEYRNRQNPNAKLLLEVKDDATIAEKALAALKENVEKAVSVSLSNPDVINDIVNIIKKVYNNHVALYSQLSSDYVNDINTDLLPYDVYRELKNEVNAYLREVLAEYGLDYTIVVKNGIIKINYYFRNSDTLNILFERYLEEYKNLYNNELYDVEEGGLAISNSKSENKVPVRIADEKKYILDNELSQTKPEFEQLITDQNYSPKKGDVVWEDATLDDRDVDEEPSVFNEIEELKETIMTKDNMISDKNIQISNLQNSITSKDERIAELEELTTDGFDIIERD